MSRDNRSRRRSAKPDETSATADDAPAVGSDDHVHSVSPKPCPLVEAVLRPAWPADLADEIEDRALRRRPAGRKPEQDRLADRLVSEAPHLARHAQVERRAPRRPSHDDDGAFGSPDLRRKRAAVESVQSRAPPPPAADRKCDSKCGQSPGGRHHDRAQRSAAAIAPRPRTNLARDWPPRARGRAKRQHVRPGAEQPLQGAATSGAARYGQTRSRESRRAPRAS